MMTADVATRTGHVFRLLVTGPFAAGTTSLIRSACDSAPVTTDVVATGIEAAVQERSTVAMDFGTWSSGDGTRALLYGTPGRGRFAFMTDMFRSSVDALVFVVDAEAAASHADAGTRLRRLARELRSPLVVAVNRCDDPIAARLLATELGVLASEAVVPCQVIDPTSAGNVVDATIDAVMGSARGLVDPRTAIERVLEMAAAA